MTPLHYHNVSFLKLHLLGPYCLLLKPLTWDCRLCRKEVFGFLSMLNSSSSFANCCSVTRDFYFHVAFSFADDVNEVFFFFSLPILCYYKYKF